jgi:endonuclease III
MNRNDQHFADLVDGDWCAICTNEWELLTAILLDSRTPLERMRKTVIALKKIGLLDYRKMREFGYDYADVDSHNKTFRQSIVSGVLKNAGYPWYNQKARYFNQDITFNLRTASLEQIDSILGIGPKLAALWMRIMNPSRQDEFCVIDTHVRRFLRDILGVDEKHTSYEELSDILRNEAKLRGLTITELDELIVENGVKKRKGLPTKPIPPRVSKS